MPALPLRLTGCVKTQGAGVGQASREKPREWAAVAIRDGYSLGDLIGGSALNLANKPIRWAITIDQMCRLEANVADSFVAPEAWKSGIFGSRPSLPESVLADKCMTDSFAFARYVGHGAPPCGGGAR